MDEKQLFKKMMLLVHPDISDHPDANRRAQMVIEAKDSIAKMLSLAKKWMLNINIDLKDVPTDMIGYECQCMANGRLISGIYCCNKSIKKGRYRGYKKYYLYNTNTNRIHALIMRNDSNIKPIRKVDKDTFEKILKIFYESRIIKPAPTYGFKKWKLKANTIYNLNRMAYYKGRWFYISRTTSKMVVLADMSGKEYCRTYPEKILNVVITDSSYYQKY